MASREAISLYDDHNLLHVTDGFPFGRVMTPEASAPLASGQHIPLLGLGTLRSSKGEVGNAVLTAIRAGYRLIDCAEVYGNEAEVGAALKEAITSGIVTRDELFVVGKLFNHHHHVDGEDRVRKACEVSVAALGGPIDLYLMHWPFAFAADTLPKEGLRRFPRVACLGKFNFGRSAVVAVLHCIVC